MQEGKVILDKETFTVELCKKKGALVTRLKRAGKLDLDALRAAYTPVSDAGIALIVQDDAAGDIIIHGFGELHFKTCTDPALIARVAERIYAQAQGGDKHKKTDKRTRNTKDTKRNLTKNKAPARADPPTQQQKKNSTEKTKDLPNIDKLRSQIQEAKRIVYLYDDDPDGLAAYLLLNKYKRGRGICVKAHPTMSDTYLAAVQEEMPDLIIGLDLVDIDEDFLKKTTIGGICRIILIDHHQPISEEKQKRITYYNPRLAGEFKSTAHCAFLITQDKHPEDIWIAAVGFIGDWTFPEPEVALLRQHYERLLPEQITSAPDALFTSPIGTIVRIFSYALKGDSKHIHKRILALENIQHPDELLDDTSAPAHLLHDHYVRIKKDYDALLAYARTQVSDDPLLIINYQEQQISLTSDLANEVYYLHPEKLVIIARASQGKMKCSVRYAGTLPPLIEQALAGLHGYGGGHEHACGVVVNEEEFEEFLERLREQLHR